MDKEALRVKIWSLMEREGVTRFPKPVIGRIPNFMGAETAAKHLTELPAYKTASVIKVNPDSPQRGVRELILRDGKTLIMPSPRLRSGFIMVNRELCRSNIRAASTIKGVFRYGKPVGLGEVSMIDLVVTGSVAVSREGARLGKGGGYGDLEYGILRELGRISEKTPVATTIHDLQVAPELPRDPYDVLIDYMITPRQTIKTERKEAQPTGILWGSLDPKKLEEIPLLRELKERDDERAVQ